MTIIELAEKIRNDFINDIKEDGFENFKEMRECYDWTPKDIRDEIEYLETKYVNEEFDETGETNIWVHDDASLESHINGKWEEVSYREIKKMVLKGL